MEAKHWSHEHDEKQLSKHISTTKPMNQWMIPELKDHSTFLQKVNNLSKAFTYQQFLTMKWPEQSLAIW